LLEKSSNHGYLGSSNENMILPKPYQVIANNELWNSWEFYFIFS